MLEMYVHLGLVSLKGNHALLEVGGNMLLLEDWAVSHWQYLYPHGHYGYINDMKNGNRLALDSDVAFFGMESLISIYSSCGKCSCVRQFLSIASENAFI